jgi:hypothetical protein
MPLIYSTAVVLLESTKFSTKFSTWDLGTVALHVLLVNLVPHTTVVQGRGATKGEFSRRITVTPSFFKFRT